MTVKLCVNCGAEEPHLLYLDRYRDLLKLGHGDARRIRAHVRAGCTPVQVLKATHREVAAAELALKHRYLDRMIAPDEWNLPPTFGAGSEVVPVGIRINLRRFLPGDDAQDVTNSLSAPAWRGER
jgi:hypothetical protein